MNYCQWLYRLEEGQQSWWGRAAINLAEAGRAGVAIPAGFALSTLAYAEFFTYPKVESGIKTAAKGLSVKSPRYFASSAQDIRKVIMGVSFSKEIREALSTYYDELHKQLIIKKGVRLTLNMGETTLSQVVHSGLELEKAIRQLYSLAFTERDVFDHIAGNLPLVSEAQAVTITYVGEPEYSGIAYVHDSTNHDDNTIEVLAWHFKRPLINALTLEDRYRLDKKSLSILSKEVKKQWWAEAEGGKFVSPLHFGKQEGVLSDKEVQQLGRQIRLTQDRHQEVMQAEWVYSHNQFWITKLTKMAGCCHEVERGVPDSPKTLLRGLSGSLGVASGPIRLVKTKKAQASVRPGEIVVLEQAPSGSYQWLASVAGIISETGNPVSAEAYIGKVVGVPAVVGVGHALAKLKTGQMVTIDGTNGAVYLGVHALPSQGKQLSKEILPATGTKICATVLHPYDKVEEQLQYADGIGLLRSEFILGLLGTHPQDIVRKKLHKEYSEVLAEGLEHSMRSVYPRSVLYQLHDITTMDLLGLHSHLRSRHEPNPALGYRGAHRLLSEPEVLDLELKALELVVKRGITNFSVMMPMARSLDEVKRMKQYLDKSSLAQEHHSDLWVKCETPGMLILMEQLCELGISGVCFDVPSLSQFMQGFDKENYQVAHRLDTSDQALEQGLRFAIGVCRKAGISTVVVSEREDLRPEIVQAAIQSGVTALSVTPNRLLEMHGLVSAIEQRMVLDHMMSEQA